MPDRLLVLVHQLVAEVRALRDSLGGELPTVLSKRRAARELDISLSKLKGLIRRGELMTCEVGRTTMVPASEVRRIAESARRQPAAQVPPAPARKRRKATTPAQEARTIRAAVKRK